MKFVIALIFMILFVTVNAKDLDSIEFVKVLPVNQISIQSNESIPANNIFQIIELLPGVYSYQNGMVINGCEPNYSTFKISGFDITDPVFGGIANIRADQYPSPSILAIESIDLNFNNTEGNNYNNLGSFVNFKLNSGNYDKFESFVFIENPISDFYGVSNHDYQVKVENQAMIKLQNNKGRNFQSARDLNFEIGIGGPLLLIDSSMFFFSYRKYSRDYNSGLEVYDPSHTNLGLLPNQRTFINNYTGSMNFKVSDILQIDINAMYGISSWENSSWLWLYAQEFGDNNTIAEREAKQLANNYIVSFVNASIHGDLTTNWHYKFGIGITNHQLESGRKATFEDPSIINGFDILKPQDKYSLNGEELIVASNGLLDQYEYGLKSGTSEDGYLRFDMPAKNPLTGYYEGNVISSTDNPYGLHNSFIFSGSAPDQIQFLDSRKFNIDLELGAKYDFWGIDNELTFGLNYDYYIYDSYICYPTGQIKIFAHSDTYNAGLSRHYHSEDLESALEPVKPQYIGTFIQNQSRYNKLFWSIGLRTELFETEIQKSNSQNTNNLKYSPRLEIGYNLNDNNLFTFSYNEYFKMQNFENLYNYQTHEQFHNVIFSNSNLQPVKSSTIKLNYSALLFDDIALKTSIFRTWFENGLSNIYIPEVPLPYFQYASDNLSECFGFEVYLNNQFTPNFSTSLIYVFSKIGTSVFFSDEISYPFSNIFPFFLDYQPTNYDIPHRLSMIMKYSTFDSELLSFWEIKPLANIDLNLTGIYQKGFAYTLTDLNSSAIGEWNKERYTDFYNFNLKLSKKIFFGSISQARTNDMYVSVSLEIFNLLNSSFQINQENLKRELSRKPTDFSSTPFYKEADLSNIATYLSDQYDQLGRRLYNKQIDSDGNGVVTQDEKFNAYSKLVENKLQMQLDMSQLRTVFINITFGF